MGKKISLWVALTAIVLTVTFAVTPAGNVSAAIADGTYQINYEMKEAGSDSTSIADGYFSKPATLTVENGAQYIQLTVTSADMVKSLSAPSGPVTVVSDSGDTRTVKFRVDGDLSQAVNMSMHVVVPEEALPGGYDMTHTARAVFNVSGLPTAGSGNGGDASSAANGDSSDNGAAGTGGAEENPPTGDSSNIVLYTLLFAGSGIALFAVRKFRAAHN